MLDSFWIVGKQEINPVSFLFARHPGRTQEILAARGLSTNRRRIGQ
jgi:hypothetical protein